MDKDTKEIVKAIKDLTKELKRIRQLMESRDKDPPIDEADPDAKPGQEFSYRKGLQVYPVEQAQLQEICDDLKEKFPYLLIETEDSAFEQLSGPFRMMQRLLKVLMTVMLVIFSVILIRVQGF